MRLPFCRCNFNWISTFYVFFDGISLPLAKMHSRMPHTLSPRPESRCKAFLKLPKRTKLLLQRSTALCLVMKLLINESRESCKNNEILWLLPLPRFGEEVPCSCLVGFVQKFWVFDKKVILWIFLFLKKNWIKEYEIRWTSTKIISDVTLVQTPNKNWIDTSAAAITFLNCLKLNSWDRWLISRTKNSPIWAYFHLSIQNSSLIERIFCAWINICFCEPSFAGYSYLTLISLTPRRERDYEWTDELIGDEADLYSGSLCAVNFRKHGDKLT